MTAYGVGMPLTEEEKSRVRAMRDKNRKRYHSWKLSAAQKEDLVRRFCAGEGVLDLARQFGIHPVTVTYHIDRAAGDR